MVTFLSPFPGRKQLPFDCQQEWLISCEVHFTIQNEKAFWEMARTPIYTFHQCIGELSQLLSEWPPIEPDKRTQSDWKSWHVPGWGRRGRRAHGQKKHHLATVSCLTVRNNPSNCILQLPKQQSRRQVECELSLFVLWCPFVFPSHLLLPSPPGVCLVSPLVRIVSFHDGRQSVSLSSF